MIAALDRAHDFAWLMRRHWRELGTIAHPWRPRSINDWIFRRLLLEPHPLDAQLCCKLGQRRFKAERIGEAASLPLLGVWSDVAGLARDWDGLPEGFMLKPTHGSGWYRAVPDRAGADRAAILAEAAGWLAQSYYRVSHEIGYREVVPRLLAEPLLPSPPGLKSPHEVHVYVFDARIAMAMSRIKSPEGEPCAAFLDRHGRRLPVTKTGRLPDPMPDPPRAAWARIEELCAQLGRGLVFLRCDFLLDGERVWASELTPYPAGGRQHCNPMVWMDWLGGVWAATRAGRPWPPPPAGAQNTIV